jgi:hypothetical protein
MDQIATRCEEEETCRHRRFFPFNSLSSANVKGEHDMFAFFHADNVFKKNGRTVGNVFSEF